MQHPAWPQTAPPPPAGSAGQPTGPPGSVPPHHYPPHHPQQQGYYPPPTQDGRVIASSGKSEAHPQHGYSHGAPPPPQGKIVDESVGVGFLYVRFSCYNKTIYGFICSFTSSYSFAIKQ